MGWLVLFFNFFRREKRQCAKDSNIKLAFKKIKKELEEHLASINENTNEVQANYEYMCELDSKIEKLNEKIDEISMFIGLTKKPDFKLNDKPIELTKKEKEVFMVLYLIGEEREYLSYREIAKKLGLTDNLVMNYLLNIIEKGVPVIKKYINNEPHVKLDDDFRMIQATQNILNINELMPHQC